MIPLPALDGGHAMFILYEAISGRKIPGPIISTLTTIGVVIILIVLVLVTFNDISSYL